MNRKHIGIHLKGAIFAKNTKDRPILGPKKGVRGGFGHIVYIDLAGRAFFPFFPALRG
jgi:hypothetical protein